jgi:nicotinamidase-related amidase
MKGDLLLIIDMQNVYAKGGEWECLDTEGAAANILRVVESGAADSAIITKFIADKKSARRMGGLQPKIQGHKRRQKRQRAFAANRRAFRPL